MTTIEVDVAIVGGAVAGAAMACHLRDSGLRVVVLEMAPSIPQVNRGDLLSPSTVKRLGELDGIGNFEKRGSTRVEQWKAIGPEGETLLHVQIADTAPPPYNYCIALPHPLLEAALIETAMARGSIDFRRNVQVSTLVKDETGMVTGVLATDENGPLEVRAAVVVACDGARSMMRKQMGINTDIQTYPYTYVMLTCERSPDQPANQNTEVWGKDGFCGLYPISADEVRCPVQAVPGELAHWRKIGVQAGIEELKSRYPYFSQMTPIDEDLHAYNILKHHAETYVVDGAFLVGDSAHCTPPYYGMGMNMAIRDTYHAAKLIVPLIKAGTKLTREKLLPYEQKCRPFNDFVIESSTEYGRVASARHKTVGAVSEAIETSSALNPQVMGAIYADYDAPFPPPGLTISAGAAK